MRRVIWGLLVLGSSAEADTIKFRATFACTDFQMTQYMLVENVREDPWLREFLLQKLGAGECRLFSAGEDVVVYERRGNLVCIGNTGSADKCWWTNARGVVRPTVDRERQGNPAGHGPEAGEEYRKCERRFAVAKGRQGRDEAVADVVGELIRPLPSRGVEGPAETARAGRHGSRQPQQGLYR
jgi:hypothetical protein